MIYFPEIRARRLTIQLRELTIGESIELSARPAHLEQANTTAFLRKAVEGAEMDDPLHWRIGERTLAVAHYIACMLGEPDFAVGEARYSDYLVPEASEVPDTVNIGELVGEDWSIRHMTGRLAESIERLDLERVNGEGLWHVGMMAAQLYRAGEADPCEMTDGQLDEWLQARVESFLDLPESEFEAMMIGFRRGQVALTHLFLLDVDSKGLICRPTREDAGIQPARFRVDSCFGRWAEAFAQRAD